MRFVPNQRGLEEIRRRAARQAIPHYQKQYDRLHQEYAGKPVAEVKDALVAMYRRNGGSITDPELTEHAETISKGTRITLAGP